MADQQADQFVSNDPNDTNPMHDMKQDQHLPGDGNTTPASPPTDVIDNIVDTAQATDTNVDPTEKYDAGIEAAAGVDTPTQTAGEPVTEDIETPAEDPNAEEEEEDLEAETTSLDGDPEPPTHTEPVPPSEPGDDPLTDPSDRVDPLPEPGDGTATEPETEPETEPTGPQAPPTDPL